MHYMQNSVYVAILCANGVSIDFGELHFSYDLLYHCQSRYLLLKKIVFIDKSIFHLSSDVNCHNVCIWDTENSHAVVEPCQLMCSVLSPPHVCTGLFLYSRLLPL